MKLLSAISALSCLCCAAICIHLAIKVYSIGMTPVAQLTAALVCIAMGLINLSTMRT